MSDDNLKPETPVSLSETPASAAETPHGCHAEKCCSKGRGKVCSFFTREAQAGERVVSWKFGVALALGFVLLWIIL